MPEQEYAQPQFFSDINTRLRDIEEKQKLIKERVLLIGKNLVEEKEGTFNNVQEMKKTVMLLKEENERMKQFIQRMSEQMQGLARKDELIILQRQFDLFRQ